MNSTTVDQPMAADTDLDPHSGAEAVTFPVRDLPLGATYVPVVEVVDALIVWVKMSTVADERDRLGEQAARRRAVFGAYADTLADVAEDRQRAADLARLPGDGLIAASAEFHATRAPELLPRGARVTGWLDADGYHAKTGLPRPPADWLAGQYQRLASPPSGAPADQLLAGWNR